MDLDELSLTYIEIVVFQREEMQVGSDNHQVATLMIRQLQSNVSCCYHRSMKTKFTDGNLVCSCKRIRIMTSIIHLLIIELIVVKRWRF